MTKSVPNALSRRERQIMDILYRRGRATAAEVRGDMPGDLSDSTVRTQLRILVDKSHARQEPDGHRYAYLPATPRRAARRHALKHVVETFFEGSTEKVVGALLGSDSTKLSEDELDRIAALVDKARKERGE